jgi:hypothetical protein
MGFVGDGIKIKPGNAGGDRSLARPTHWSPRSGLRPFWVFIDRDPAERRGMVLVKPTHSNFVGRGGSEPKLMWSPRPVLRPKTMASD